MTLDGFWGILWKSAMAMFSIWPSLEGTVEVELKQKLDEVS
jgi:hypothetical protein